MRFLIFSLICIAQPVVAESIFDRCVNLVESGKNTEAVPLAKQIKNFSGTTAENIPKVEKCLTGAFGIEYVFVPELDEVVAIDKANEFFARQQQVVDAQEAEKELLQRQEAAYLFTLKTCMENFKIEPEKIILSPVCNPIFLKHGLPNSD